MISARGRSRVRVAGAALALALAPGCASIGSRAASTTQAASEYEALVARARAGDPSLDWAALRLAFTHTDAYRPHQRSDAQQRLATAMQSGDVTAADAAAAEVLDVSFIDLYAHIARGAACRERADSECEKSHGRTVRRLAGSIEQSGSGKADSPRVVISNDELSAWLFLRGLRLLSHATESCANGKICERVSLESVREGRPSELFFDVSIPFAAQPR